LKGLYSSGEIARIYDKWFTKPIPAKNIALNFSMGAVTFNIAFGSRASLGARDGQAAKPTSD
jgi:hypothetical protein